MLRIVSHFKLKIVNYFKLSDTKFCDIKLYQRYTK